MKFLLQETVLKIFQVYTSSFRTNFNRSVQYFFCFILCGAVLSLLSGLILAEFSGEEHYYNGTAFFDIISHPNFYTSIKDNTLLFICCFIALVGANNSSFNSHEPVVLPKISSLFSAQKNKGRDEFLLVVLIGVTINHLLIIGPIKPDKMDTIIDLSGQFGLLQDQQYYNRLNNIILLLKELFPVFAAGCIMIAGLENNFRFSHFKKYYRSFAALFLLLIVFQGALYQFVYYVETLFSGFLKALFTEPSITSVGIDFFTNLVLGSIEIVGVFVIISYPFILDFNETKDMAVEIGSYRSFDVAQEDK